MRWSVLVGRAVLLAGLGLPALSMADVVPVNAFSVDFGAAVDLAGGCTLVGNPGDRNCTRIIDIDNGAADAHAKLSVKAQASADTVASYGNLVASATNNVHYVVPFVVSRTVNVAQVGGQYIAVVPELSLNFTYNYGAVAATKDEAGTGSERADVGSLTVTLTGASPWVVPGVGQSGETGAPDFNPIGQSDTRSFSLGVGPSVGEVGTLADIPLTMNLWSDEVGPFVDYTTNRSFVQTYSGTVSVEVSLFARSIATQSCIGPFCTEGNGGEAIACLGASSELSGFDLDLSGCPVGLDLDWDPVKNGGLTISAALTQTGIGLERIGPVPEPATTVLMLAGLGWLLGVRRLRQPAKR